MQEKRLFLLDAYALIFRAYYALIKMPRITQAGFNTSAIFGFVNTLEEILRKENPSHIAVCFDPQGPTFRNEAYEQYKAEREATPEDIRLSVPIIKEIVKAYSIPVVEVEGYEADDVIGTLAKRAEKEGFTTYMMTPDKDYGQLVAPSILQYKPAYRGQDFELRGEEEVCQRYGIDRPAQVIDLLALMGDKIDNIPGCPGIGEKTAVKLIHDFGSVENLLENTGSLKGALKKKVEENAEQIRFSKFLATIRTDVPLEIKPDDLSRKPADRDKLFAIFRELEFRTLIDRVGRRLKEEEGVPGFVESTPKENRGAAKPAAAPSLFDDEDFNPTATGPSPSAPEPSTSYDAAKDEYLLADTPERLRELSDILFEKKECGVFLLADGENDATSAWVGTAIAFEEGKARYIPASFEEGNSFVLDLLARPDIMKISANTKRDYVVASRRRTDNARAVANYYDVALAHYILQPEMRHGVADLSAQYLNRLPLPLPQPAAGARKTARSFSAASLTTDALLPWACEQADLALRLRAPLEKELQRESDEMRRLLYDVEFPLVEVLADMELTGVRIDVAALNEAAKDMERRIARLEEEIHELAGEKINVGSPAKLAEKLIDL